MYKILYCNVQMIIITPVRGVRPMLQKWGLKRLKKLNHVLEWPPKPMIKIKNEISQLLFIDEKSQQVRF